MRDNSEKFILRASCRFRFSTRLTLGFEQPQALLFRPLTVCHVAREAARVNELSVLEQGVGIYQHVSNTPVFAPQACLPVPQGFAALQPLEHVFDHGLVDMKLGDVVPDILVTRVSEKVQLRLVRPQNSPICPDPMASDSRVVEEDSQLSLRTRH